MLDPLARAAQASARAADPSLCVSHKTEAACVVAATCSANLEPVMPVATVSAEQDTLEMTALLVRLLAFFHLSTSIFVLNSTIKTTSVCFSIP